MFTLNNDWSPQLQIIVYLSDLGDLVGFHSFSQQDFVTIIKVLPENIKHIAKFLWIWIHGLCGLLPCHSSSDLLKLLNTGDNI